MPIRFLENNNYFVDEENVVAFRVHTECSTSSCESCKTYRQMTLKPNISYRALLRKTISEQNTYLCKKLIIIAVSFLASLINFSRLADFKEEQLYLETVLCVLLYYLATSSLAGASALFTGGLFHWFLAFGTKSKSLILIVMTCLQVAIESLRYYEWLTMVEHLFISCIMVHITVVLKTHYVTIMLYCVASAYCYYMYHFGIGIEDLLLSSIIVFANHYATTGNTKHCHLTGNMSSLIVWIMLKKIRESTGYCGLGIKLF